MQKIAKELLKIAKQMIAKQKVADKVAKNIKSFGAFGDEDLAIDLKEDIIDLIKKKKATESNVKNLVNRYEKVKYDYLDIDLVIDELDQFAKFNERYEDEVNKVCKILQKI